MERRQQETLELSISKHEVHGFVPWIPTLPNGDKLTHCAGDDDSTTVSEDIGRLELIIRHFQVSELDRGNSDSDSSDDGMLVGPSTIQRGTRKHRGWIVSESDENNNNDKDVEENDSNSDKSGSTSSDSDNTEDENEPDEARLRRRGNQQSKGATLKDEEDDSESNESESTSSDSDDLHGARPGRRGTEQSKGVTRTSMTTEFAEFKNSKPRQTHSAE